MSIQNIGGASGSVRAPDPAPVPSTPAGQVATQVKQTEQPQANAPAAEKLDDNQLKAALERLQKAASTSASSLQFSVDNDTGKTIVRVTDRTTGELIRQIPSEELLDIARSIDRLQGMLLKQQA